MKEKKTRYRKTCDIKLTVICSVFLGIFVIVFIWNVLFADLLLLRFASGIFLLIIICGLIGVVQGIAKGKKEIKIENELIKNTNSYIYYRELPNSFGIGVASLLFDSTIENEKDIVAVILDLCARKYLRLTKKMGKYMVEVLKQIDSELLSNEKYIMSCILYDNIQNINYEEWYNYCMQDGITLGLYVREEVNVKHQTPVYHSTIQIVLIVDACIAIGVSLFMIIFGIFASESVITALFSGIFIGFLVFIFLLIPSYLIVVLIASVTIGKNVAKMNYKNIKDNTLMKTKKGIEEVQKLYSFRAFLRDFGNFVDKNAEEVVLWDRYLSYAQVFGLTKEIMKSGYEQLVHNSSFDIDGIDGIHLKDVVKYDTD